MVIVKKEWAKLSNLVKSSKNKGYYSVQDQRYTIRPRLIRKCILVFLFVLIELFFTSSYG